MNQINKTLFAVLGIGAAVTGAWGLRAAVTSQPSPPLTQPQVMVRGIDLVFDKPAAPNVITLTGKTAAVATVPASAVRAVGQQDRLHVRVAA